MAGKSREIRLLLISTGSTEWCLQHRLLGSTDLPLSAAALRAARASAAQLEEHPLEAVLCGPDEASLVTARAFAETTGSKVRSLDGIANPSLGLWEGMSADDAEEKYPRVYRQWCEDPSAVSLPDAEDFADAEDRILRTLAKAVLKQKCGAPIAVVLRPVAGAIVRCWLESLPSSRVRWMIDRMPLTQWRSVPRERFEAVLTELNAAG
jgi:broad specificity phosphatase PhoE